MKINISKVCPKLSHWLKADILTVCISKKFQMGIVMFYFSMVQSGFKHCLLNFLSEGIAFHLDAQKEP